MTDTDTIAFERTVPVRHHVDVLVAGGGPAGVAAGVAAARQGARVLIIEATGAFGGMGTMALVPAFMPFGNGVEFLAGGIGGEVYDRAFETGVNGPSDRRDKQEGSAFDLHIKAEPLKRLYDDLVSASGADFLFQTRLVAVEREGGRVTHAVCAAKSGLFAVAAGAFVDCTGDGDLAAWAGAPFEKGDAGGTMMPGTLCSLWVDLDWEAIERSGLHAQDELPRAFADGVFTFEDRHLPGFWRVGETWGGGNIGHTFGVDGTDERSVTRALVWGRKLVLEYERFYREYLKGHERMKLAATGALLGVRETRRIMGDYVLGIEDFFRRASFPDEIGRYNYWVDQHPAAADEKSFSQFYSYFRGGSAYRYGPGESYGIPYRILTPKGLDNVLVAGRCVSTDRHMQSSIRVMPGCFITGQAAGVAAAMSARAGVDTRSLDVKDLRSRLKALGAFLPGA